MLTYSAKSFDELATPLSRNKIFLLIDVAKPERAEQIDLYPIMLQGLGISVDDTGIIEGTSERKYLVAETDVTDQNRELGLAVVDFFRQHSIKEVAKAYLFIDEQLLECSGDGLPSTYDLVTQLPTPCYRFKESIS